MQKIINAILNDSSWSQPKLTQDQFRKVLETLIDYHDIFQRTVPIPDTTLNLKS